MNQKGFASLILIIVIIVVVSIGGYFVLDNRPTTPILTPPIDEQSTLPPTPTPSPATTPSTNIPSSTSTPLVSLLRVCPEEWYSNRMPSTVGSNDVPSEYFVYKGVRRELSEFDINWVKTNCLIKSQAVY